MGFKNFKINVIVRLGIILGLMAILFYFLFLNEKYLRSIYVAAVLIFAIGELLRYIDKRNREVNLFLSSLLNDDYSLTFSNSDKGKSFSSLYQTMNAINSKFEKLRSDKEVHSRYLQTLVEHIKVGIISFDSSGKIHLVNQAFKDLFNNQTLRPNSYLTGLDPEFVELFRNLKPDVNLVKKLFSPGGQLRLSLKAAIFKLENEEFKLISVQNIREELEEQELMAWQKLIRVLTHEIMNSVTPISSLSSSLHNLVKDKPCDESLKTKLINGLEAIINRSKGLMKFTEAYKTISRMPPPVFTPVKSEDFIKRVEMLCKMITKDLDLELEIEADPDPWVFYIDTGLLDNVIINLVKNSMEAMDSSRQARLSISLKHSNIGKTILELKDNGRGMNEEIMSEIFVPFFTTKRNGSGIGLSLSNQIIRSHGGIIQVSSQPGEGATFIIIL